MERERIIEVIEEKVHSMRFSKKDVQKETSRDAKQFMYGYTECINDLLEYLATGGDGLPEHSLAELSEVKEPAVTDEQQITTFTDSPETFVGHNPYKMNSHPDSIFWYGIEYIKKDCSRLQPAQITDEEYVDKSISIDQYLNANPQIDPHEQTGDNDFSDEDMNHAITGE
jgi:hypothetical protein